MMRLIDAAELFSLASETGCRDFGAGVTLHFRSPTWCACIGSTGIAMMHELIASVF
jgi:hypothetical protein